MKLTLTKNYIYFKSPIGKALIGKKKKDLSYGSNTIWGEEILKLLKVEVYLIFNVFS